MRQRAPASQNVNLIKGPPTCQTWVARRQLSLNKNVPIRCGRHRLVCTKIRSCVTSKIVCQSVAPRQNACQCVAAPSAVCTKTHTFLDCLMYSCRRNRHKPNKISMMSPFMTDCVHINCVAAVKNSIACQCHRKAYGRPRDETHNCTAEMHVCMLMIIVFEKATRTGYMHAETCVWVVSLPSADNVHCLRSKK